MVFFKHVVKRRVLSALVVKDLSQEGLVLVLELDWILPVQS